MITNIYLETPLRRVSVSRFNTEHPKKLLKIFYSDNLLAGAIMIYEDGSSEACKVNDKNLDNPDMYRWATIVMNRHRVQKILLKTKEEVMAEIERWMQEIMKPCTSQE
jgi:hypothetical protein